ncbi:MAG: hypothetical protein VCC04_14775 [Myxococcota bacterium]
MRVMALRSLPVLLLLACSAGAQLPTDDPAAAQKKWYERKKERPNLNKGAFEVLRFSAGYEFKPRYKHDPKRRKRILKPDYWCNQCEREGRIPESEGRKSHRLMERDEPQVLDWLATETKSRRFTFLEDGQFKLYMDLPGLDLKKFRNPHLKEELRELGDVFPKVTEKTAALNGHQRAHLYLIRAHRLLRDFLWMVGHSGSESIKTSYPWLGPYLGMKAKPECYVFERKRPYMQFNKRFIGRAASDGQCWHLFRDRAMIFTMQCQNHVDPQTQGYFLHKLMHNLLDSYRMYSFKLPAWFQMGMGHWVERRESTRYNSFCFSEGVIPRVLFATRWAPKVKKMVAKGKAVPFVQACSTKEYGDFLPEYHMVTYSWVCYLWRLGPEKMRIFINELKSKKETESVYQAQIRAFRKAYNISLIQFDTGWREWVKKVYPDV